MKISRLRRKKTPGTGFSEITQLYLAAFAQLDTQFRWNYAASISRYLKQTLEENFSLLEAYPHYRFNFPGAVRYAMVKEYYPELFHRLERYIREHRWYPAGTALEETDAVIPSAESMIRNILYGQRFFLREFNYSSTDYMLPGSYGFPETTPSILAHCGISGFSTRKPRRKPRRMSCRLKQKLPFTLGIWISPNGDSVPAAIEAADGSPHSIVPLITFAKWFSDADRNRKKFSVPKSYRFFGRGNTGGAPDQKAAARLEKLLERPVPRLRLEASDRIFTSLTLSEKEKLPAYTGDMLPSCRSAGSYTSQAMLKRWNRMNEQLAFAAETAAAASFLINGSAAPYPADRLEQAWHRVIGSQQHTVMQGIASPEAYMQTYNDEAVALNTFSSILEDAAESIARRMALNNQAARNSKEHALLAFNPAGISRNSITEAEISGVEYSSKLRAYDPEGNLLPMQILDQKGNRASVLIAAPLPAASWTLLSAHEHAHVQNPPIQHPVSIRKINGGIQMENRLYRLKISSAGLITSIYLKETDGLPGKEFLAAPIQYALLREKPHPNSFESMHRVDRKKKPLISAHTGARILVTEQGPLRATVSVEFALGRGSRVIKKISLCSTGDEELIQITDRFSWQERGWTLKVGFPLAVSNPRTFTGRNLSHKQQGKNTPDLYEFPFHTWLDHTDTTGEFGMSIICPGKYGFDKPEDNILRLTLLHTPARWPLFSLFNDQSTQDWGRHCTTYSLYPHRGDAAAADTETAVQKVSIPIRFFHPTAEKERHFSRHPQQQSPEKLLPKRIGLYTISTSQVSVTACKMAEDDHEKGTLILRLKENQGKPLESGELHFATRILEAAEVSGTEQIIGNVKTFGHVLHFSIKAHGIKTFSIRLAAYPGRKYAENLPYAFMEFPRNTRLISTNGDAAAGSGPLFPAELIPEIISNGPIPFRIEKKEDLHAVSCGGELLTLPDITPGIRADTLYILGAADTDVDGVFSYPEAKNSEVVLHFPPMTGFTGQYDTRIWEQPPGDPADYRWKNRCIRVDPGYIMRERLEWYATHMHSAGIDFPCYYGYLYRFRIDLPPGVGSIQLPRDARIKILAITASVKSPVLQKASILRDPFDFR